MRKIIYLGFLILFISCNFNTVYNNRETDLQDAEEVAFELFTNIESGNYKEANMMFSSKFFDHSSESELNALFDSIKTLGAIKNRQLVDWKTFVIEGSNAKAEYVLRYSSVYPNHQTDETLSMEKENDSIKIYGFQVHSTSFE